MSRFVKVLLAANAVLLAGNLLNLTGNWVGLSYAQIPPQTTADGVPFLKVNINPTEVPPLVDINPHQTVPKVEVMRMPEVQVRFPPPGGCDARQNFQTGIGRSVTGPMVLTYLNVPQQGTVTLVDRGGNQRLNLGTGAQLTTALYLGTGQRLEFDANVIYSGCLPN